MINYKKLFILRLKGKFCKNKSMKKFKKLYIKLIII